MHLVMIPYGKRDWVELLLREMEAQKHKLNMYKGEDEKYVYIQGQVRLLPFGLVEYVFPKEDLSKVLSTLDNNGNKAYGVGKFLPIIRKALRLKKIPKERSDERYLWIREHVGIILVGIREDDEILDPKLDMYHESI